MRRGRREREAAPGPPGARAGGGRPAWHGAEAGPDAVVCLLCNREFRAITYKHLRRIHDFEGDHPIQDYKQRFGLEVAACRAPRRALRRTTEEYWERRGQRWPGRRVLAELRRRATAYPVRSGGG